MSSRDQILNNIRRNTKQVFDKPQMNLSAIEFDDKLTQFIEVSKAVGGDAIILKEGEDINEVIRALYPEAKEIASVVNGIHLTTLDPDSVESPNDLNNVDLAIVEGAFGVCENGCIWLPQQLKHKALYFITQYLVIVLDRSKLVNNMHEGYELITPSEKGFGVYISGPSKTADIEQALVVGAHGPKGLTVILK
ncbi:LutC/YkgG family protein [Myroides odoratimimus]|uniref:LutC/YkgG family protein n=1 Tax=Myroides odoratimimus TaxID=76832 RepID=UPI00103EF11A|nr:LUD domain-containing protein [Myroides odoratimimus]MDM1444934.1 LUD domain-containing protein [Myroides odoratimimus]MDM1450987.1 LUD domain-containing protein [Myroides odoratimimus]MDM1454970.1 LUD domain-containing protein [Myroides odoratimimus]MDM1478688.1 LUD domain-containing protein [Myroides odoratimimus]MDM1491017.1 LUD domain-containing protein [Myroides odoratimimus]